MLDAQYVANLANNQHQLTFFMEKMCDQQRKLAATQILTWRETRVGKVGEYVCTFTLKGHL